MIPQYLLDKYGLLSLEERKKNPLKTEKDCEFDYYNDFLIQTDHIPNKIVESLVEELANATLLNFIEIFLKFIVSIRIEYKEILQQRKHAREKINELKQSTTP